MGMNAADFIHPYPELLERYGTPLEVTTGASRVVVLFQDVAVKIPKAGNREEGLAANREEHRWGTIGHPALCPVIDAHPDSEWIAMPRCRIMTEEELEGG